MPWRVWVATLNTVHGEDDISYWLSKDANKGAAAVADGVSTTGGGGASYLAAHGFTLACRILAREASLNTLRSCLSYVSKLARESNISDADTIAEVKRRYYKECSQGGTPCVTPLDFDTITLRPLRAAQPQPRELGAEIPATTLLGALFAGNTIALTLAGDGIVMGAGTSKEETWLLWGALPQFFEGSRLARFVEIGSGLHGYPIEMVLRSEPGHVYVLATDGVDPATLAETLMDIVLNYPSPVSVGNPAAYLLRKILEETGGFEDDASLVFIYHTS